MPWWFAAQAAMVGFSTWQKIEGAKAREDAALRNAEAQRKQIDLINEQRASEIRRTKIQGQTVLGQQVLGYAKGGVDISAASPLGVIEDGIRVEYEEVERINREADIAVDLIQSGIQAQIDNAKEQRRNEVLLTAAGAGLQMASIGADWYKHNQLMGKGTTEVPTDDIEISPDPDDPTLGDPDLEGLLDESGKAIGGAGIMGIGYKAEKMREAGFEGIQKPAPKGPPPQPLSKAPSPTDLLSKKLARDERQQFGVQPSNIAQSDVIRLKDKKGDVITASKPARPFTPGAGMGVVTLPPKAYGPPKLRAQKYKDLDKFAKEVEVKPGKPREISTTTIPTTTTTAPTTTTTTTTTVPTTSTTTVPTTSTTSVDRATAIDARLKNIKRQLDTGDLTSDQQMRLMDEQERLVDEIVDDLYKTNPKEATDIIIKNNDELAKEFKKLTKEQQEFAIKAMMRRHFSDLYIGNPLAKHTKSPDSSTTSVRPTTSTTTASTTTAPTTSTTSAEATTSAASKSEINSIYDIPEINEINWREIKEVKSFDEIQNNPDMRVQFVHDRPDEIPSILMIKVDDAREFAELGLYPDVSESKFEELEKEALKLATRKHIYSTALFDTKTRTMYRLEGSKEKLSKIISKEDEISRWLDRKARR